MIGSTGLARCRDPTPGASSPTGIGEQSSGWTTCRAESPPKATQRCHVRAGYCRFLDSARLHGDQAGIDAILGQQLLVPPGLHTYPAIQHDDLIGLCHRRETMGNDDRGAVLHQAVERLLNDGLTLRVHVRGGLIEDQDRRIFQDGAGYCETLPLPSRQLLTPLADDGVVAGGEVEDEVVGVGGSGGGFDLFARGIRLAQQQVLGDGAVEQVGILRDQCELCPQCVQR